MSSLKLYLLILSLVLLMSGCAQKVRIKALNPAEVGEMASRKIVAVSEFSNDRYGLSGKIESKIASHKLDRKRYFTLVSKRDMDKILQHQELQSSELVDEKTAVRVGRIIGAQALVNGDVNSNAKYAKYYVDRKKCLKYGKKITCTKYHYSRDGKTCLKYKKINACLKYKYYKERCDTINASVSVNINIVDIETASIIYGDSISKEYNGDSCKRRLLSKTQALNKLTSSIASQFVHKLTPHYVYFNVSLIEDIELDYVTDTQEDSFENSLGFIKVGRMNKAGRMLQNLLDELDGRSYVVAYTYGVVNEAQGKFDKAHKLYYMANDLTNKPVDEINMALTRIDSLISNRDEAREQINAK